MFSLVSVVNVNVLNFNSDYHHHNNSPLIVLNNTTSSTLLYIYTHSIIHYIHTIYTLYSIYIYLFIYAVPPQVHGLPSLRTAVEGQMVELQCEASGFPTPKISWTRGRQQLDSPLKEHDHHHQVTPYPMRIMLST